MPASAGVRKTITTAATLLAPSRSRAQRAALDIDNDSAVTIYVGIGNAAVTTTTGRPLLPGESMAIVNTAHDSQATYAVYGIVATGTASVLVSEST